MQALLVGPTGGYHDLHVRDLGRRQALALIVAAAAYARPG